MPSPFPGMNPYLEHPAVWPDFHDGFIYRLRAAIAPLVRPKYFVRMQEQVYLHELPSNDMRLIGRPDLTFSESPFTQPDAAGAVAVLPSPARVTVLDPVDEIRSASLEIVDRTSDRVVTAIELLSPSNKQPGLDRQQYLQKRRSLLKAGVNFVELDFLCGGPRTVASIPACDYVILIARTPELPEAGVWPFGLTDPMPSIPIPLKAGEAEPLIDLKAVLDAVNDESAFADHIYRNEPVPELSAGQAEWARAFVP